MTKPFDFKQALEAQAALHKPEKAEKNRRADLRRQGRFRSLINWKTVDMLDQPLNYSSQNRREERRDAELGRSENTDLSLIRNNGRRRRIERFLHEERIQIQGTQRQLAPLKIGDSRRDKRKQSAGKRRRRLAVLNPLTGAKNTRTWQARKEIEQRVYDDAVREWNAQRRDQERVGGTVEPLRTIKARIAQREGVTWRAY